MSLSPAARILADFLADHPAALGELLWAERLAARDPSPDTPALSAARVLGPWTPDGEPGGSLERVELVHGLLVAAVVPIGHLVRRSLIARRGLLSARGDRAWVGLVWDHHQLGEIEQHVAGSADTPEEACALTDALLADEVRRWRLL